MVPEACTNKIIEIPYIRGFLVFYFPKNYGNFHYFHIFRGNFMVIFNYKYLSVVAATSFLILFSKCPYLLTVVE